MPEEALGYSWYDAMDTSQPVTETKFYYVLIVDKENPDIIKCIVPCFLKSVPIDLTLPEGVSKVLRFILKPFSGILYQRVLFIGSLVARGHIGISPHIKRHDFMEVVDKAFMHLRQEAKAKITVWKDVNLEDDRELQGELCCRGYFQMISFPEMAKQLKGATFQEHLKHISTSRARKLASRIKKAKQGISYEPVIFKNPSEEDVALFYTFFEQNYEKYASNRVRFESIHPEYFQKMAKADDNVFISLQSQGKIIALWQSVVRGKTLYSIYYGIDYARFGDRSNLYFALEEPVVTYALSQGIQKIYIGQNSYTVKFDMGYLPEPLYSYAKHETSWLHKIFRKLLMGNTWADLSPELATYLKAHPETLKTFDSFSSAP